MVPSWPWIVHEVQNVDVFLHRDLLDGLGTNWQEFVCVLILDGHEPRVAIVPLERMWAPKS